MIRKAVIVLFSLLAVWTTIESVLCSTIGWECPHPLLFEAGGFDQCGYGMMGEPAAVGLGCTRLITPRMTPPAPTELKLDGLIAVRSGMFLMGPVTAFYSEEHVLYVRTWLAVPLLAAYPLIAFIRGPLRRRRRRKRGLCLTCGYNLTGNTSGVCPECSSKVEG